MHYEELINATQLNKNDSIHKTTIFIFKIITISIIFLFFFYQIFIWFKPYCNFISIITSLIDPIKGKLGLNRLYSQSDANENASLLSNEEFSSEINSNNNSNHFDFSNNMIFVMFDINQHNDYEKQYAKALELNKHYSSKNEFEKQVESIFKETLFEFVNTKNPESEETRVFNLLKFEKFEINQKSFEKALKASLFRHKLLALVKKRIKKSSNLFYKMSNRSKLKRKLFLLQKYSSLLN